MQLTERARLNLKRLCELDFWRKHHARASGRADNAHFKDCFTSLFNISTAAYDDAAIADIGCGPLGTLEWASNARLRVGLDPLADKYLDLGTSQHAMSYVKANAEQTPFPSSSFDFVSCFNALDHVEDPGAALSEMFRICCPGGRILLMVEINHAPTTTEPHILSMQDIVGHSTCACIVEQAFVLVLRDDYDIYASVRDGAIQRDPSAHGVACVALRRA